MLSTSSWGAEWGSAASRGHARTSRDPHVLRICQTRRASRNEADETRRSKAAEPRATCAAGMSGKCRTTREGLGTETPPARKRYVFAKGKGGREGEKGIACVREHEADVGEARSVEISPAHSDPHMTRSTDQRSCGPVTRGPAEPLPPADATVELAFAEANARCARLSFCTKYFATIDSRYCGASVSDDSMTLCSDQPSAHGN
ncbi:hypothetical protein EVG20_g2576 [Dentipellis fragilis]|uniref:Uncharacterized protein n=1 Tax=Dentipellis fragilis TaxID=205917 RepID=A0A4Y9Z7K1_9AGAM|nr:hypothetical protein EVG20_g2576 [Dentipellis fragilis]